MGEELSLPLFSSLWEHAAPGAYAAVSGYNYA